MPVIDNKKSKPRQDELETLDLDALEKDVYDRIKWHDIDLMMERAVGSNPH